jgi:hypothetical protein
MGTRSRKAQDRRTVEGAESWRGRAPRVRSSPGCLQRRRQESKENCLCCVDPDEIQPDPTVSTMPQGDCMLNHDHVPRAIRSANLLFIATHKIQTLPGRGSLSATVSASTARHGVESSRVRSALRNQASSAMNWSRAHADDVNPSRRASGPSREPVSPPTRPCAREGRLSVACIWHVGTCGGSCPCCPEAGRRRSAGTCATWAVRVVNQRSGSMILTKH